MGVSAGRAYHREGRRIDFEFVKHATLEYENGVNVTSEFGTFPNGIIVVKEEK